MATHAVVPVRHLRQQHQSELRFIEDRSAPSAQTTRQWSSRSPPPRYRSPQTRRAISSVRLTPLQSPSLLIGAQYPQTGASTEFSVLPLTTSPLVPESSGNGAVGFVADIHSSGLITPVATSSLANVPGRTYANIGKRWRKEWRMSGSDESGFLPTSSTQNYGGVAWAFTFAAASQIFGYYTVLWKVQFRSQA